MIVRIREEAEREDAFDHYEQQRQGLALELLDEHVRAAHKIVERPLGWPANPAHSDARRCRLDRFPYALVYRIEPTQCMIIAVAHLKRRPGYWIERMK